MKVNQPQGTHSGDHNMGRRHRNYGVGYADTHERASLGDSHVDCALGNINSAQVKSVSLRTKYHLTLAQTLPMFIPDDVLDKVAAAKPFVVDHREISNFVIQAGVKLHCDFGDSPWITVDEAALQENPARIQPLLAYIAQVKAVHDTFEEVKAVLKWLNRNATPGAIRYYWPTAMKLCPDSPAWKGLPEVPTRFSQPANIGEWLQPMRDAAATMAGAAFIPADTATPVRNEMWLTLPETLVCPTVHSSYTTNARTYNI
jgi:hypothetical protein